MAGEQATTVRGALPLSYAGIIPAAGFEPATSRLTGEVTVIFTTGRNVLLFSTRREPGESSRFVLLPIPSDCIHRWRERFTTYFVEHFTKRQHGFLGI